jgi:hypothetical protein
MISEPIDIGIGFGVGGGRCGPMISEQKSRIRSRSLRPDRDRQLAVDKYR